MSRHPIFGDQFFYSCHLNIQTSSDHVEKFHFHRGLVPKGLKANSQHSRSLKRGVSESCKAKKN